MAQQIDEQFAHFFVQHLHAAVNAHDADAVAELCTEDVLWKDPAAPEPLRGREAVRRFHRDMMFRSLPDARIELIDGPYFLLDRKGVAVRLRITGKMTGPMEPPGFAPTGGPVEFETAEFSRFDGELLARHTVVLDRLALARQVGAVPRAGGLAERVNVWLQRLVARRARKRWG
ncbi:ester cyclase [Aquisalimonas sp.]|uniref:ester cyclase n=1 Tax=Aquisalimonas sp. TaxID=1872621 RepID=UPI0025B9BAA7|nr:ester cyclase [Aquisalimonas sp.]